MIPNWIFRTSWSSPRPHIRAISELTLLAFYFLLRVGEYTQPNAYRPTCMQQFCLQDVVFYSQQQPLPLSSIWENPNLPDLVRLCIDNQKNGRRGQILSHQAISDDCCPVKAATAQIVALLNNGAGPNTLICAYKNNPTKPFQHVTSDDILTAVCTTIPHNPDSAIGYIPNIVGTHLLRAGGAVALYQQGYDATTIMKLGHWTSTAFMSYIHEQLDIISNGVAQQMSNTTLFINLDIQQPLDPGRLTSA